jgi:hypothetical protein
MELVIEAMDESGPCGLPSISVAHYGEQNGDAMRDPEMCFELGFAGGAHLNPTVILKEAAATYKVDTDGITAKVRQEFAAKEKAKKTAQPAVKNATKAA